MDARSIAQHMKHNHLLTSMIIGGNESGSTNQVQRIKFNESDSTNQIQR